jgi:hypothetical protein
MSDEMKRLLSEALQSQRVLVNPTEDELRHKAEELREKGELKCTACRKPIYDELFETRRVTFGPRIEAIAHLHMGCAEAFRTSMTAEDVQH